jgi:hypothetical protein
MQAKNPPVKRLGMSTSDIQSLVVQIIELVRNNQAIVNEVVRDNTELRNKVSDLVSEMRKLISLIEASSEEPEIETKPMVDNLKKIVEQNQKLIESNQAVLERLDTLNRKVRGGTPISQLLAAYPKVKLRRRQ